MYNIAEKTVLTTSHNVSGQTSIARVLAHTFVRHMFDRHVRRSTNAFDLRHDAVFNLITSVAAATSPNWGSASASVWGAFDYEIHQLTRVSGNKVVRTANPLIATVDLTSCVVSARLESAVRTLATIQSGTVRNSVLGIVSDILQAVLDEEAVPAQEAAPAALPLTIADHIMAVMRDQSRFTKRSKRGIRAALTAREYVPTDTALTAALNALVDDLRLATRPSLTHGTLYMVR